HSERYNGQSDRSDRSGDACSAYCSTKRIAGSAKAMAIDSTAPITPMDQKADEPIVTGNIRHEARDVVQRARLGLVLGGRHPVTLCGMSQVFENEPDYAILAVCTDAEATLEAVRRHQPDIVILDLDRSGTFKVLRRVHRQAPGARVIVLTS